MRLPSATRSQSDQEPTVELVREAHEAIQKEWSAQFAVDTDLELLGLDEHTVFAPDTNNPDRKDKWEPERMTSGEPQRIEEQVISLVSKPADIEFVWTGAGIKTETQAENLAKAYAEARDQLNGPGTEQPLRTGRGQMVSLGRQAMLFAPGDAYWWDAPKFREEGHSGETNVKFVDRRRAWERKAPLPILWRPLPVKSTFPTRLSRADDEALTWITTSWAELRDIFSPEELALAEMPDDIKKWYEPVTLAVYSNRTWLAYSVLKGEKSGMPGFREFDDKLIRTVKHRLGKVAIRIMPGVTSPVGTEAKPGTYYRGILFSVRAILKQVDARLSEAATASYRSVLPQLKVWVQQREGETASARIERVLHGDIVDLAPGEANGEGREDAEPLHIPSTIQDALGLAQFGIQQGQAISGATEALMGLNPPSGQPAWSTNVVTQVALSKFSPLAAAVTAADIDSAEMVMRSVAAWENDVELQRRTSTDAGKLLLPHEGILDWIATTTADLDPDIPTDKRTEFSLGLDALVTTKRERLGISRATIMKRLMDIDDPMEELRQARVDEFLDSPEMQKWILKQALEEADVQVAEAEAATMEDAERMAAAGQLPPEMLAFLRQQEAQRQGGGGGGSGAGGRNGLSNEAAGQIKAESPFSQGPATPAGV